MDEPDASLDAAGVDGAPLSTLGDFGTTGGIDLGLGYIASPALRLEAVEGVLAEGYRTADIASDGGDVVGTERMGMVLAGRV